MAAVTINTGDAYHEDRLAESPREKWPAILADRRLYLKTRVDHDCRCLVQYVAEAEEFYTELGYDSAEEMILDAYGIRPEQALAAVEYLQGRSTAELQKAIPMAAAAAQSQPLKKHGGERSGAGRPTRLAEAAEQAQPLRPYGDAAGNQADHISLKGEFGTSRDYLLRRLARDRPDVLERVKAGEFKSARAAAIEAGIINPVPTVRLSNPQKVAAKIRAAWPADRISQLVSLLVQ